jgi:hypothetical protein
VDLYLWNDSHTNSNNNINFETMKVKIKLCIEELAELLAYIQRSTFENITELQILNIRLFMKFAIKKLVDLTSEIQYNKTRLKVFSIDVNQYTALMALLTNERNNLDPYMLTVFITLQEQNKQLLHLN